MRRLMVRAILIVAFVLAIGVVCIQGIQFWLFGYSKVEWNSIAASLAVVTAIISAWTMQTSFEKQEEAQRPYPYPTLDPFSRNQLLQLQLTNMGASTAYDIRLKWDKPLMNREGNPARFSQRDPEVPLLLPNQSIAVKIDISADFLSKTKDADYSGVVEFKDNPQSNKIFRHNFYISAEMYRGLLRNTSEEQITQVRLQELPNAIKGITTELEHLREDLNKAYKPERNDVMLADMNGKPE